MAKKQTRRAISINDETYDKLRAYADSTGESMSCVVERVVNDEIARVTCTAVDESLRGATLIAAVGELGSMCMTCGALPGELCRYIGDRGAVRHQDVVHSSRGRAVT